MPSLQQRKCPCLVVGLVIVIVLGLFGYTGMPLLGKSVCRWGRVAHGHPQETAFHAGSGTHI